MNVWLAKIGILFSLFVFFFQVKLGGTHRINRSLLWGHVATVVSNRAEKEQLPYR